MGGTACPEWLSHVAGPLCRPALSAFDLGMTPALAMGLVVLLWFEQRRPLRRRTQRLRNRLSTNAGVAILAMIVMRAALLPAVVAIATLTESAGVGVTRIARLPPLVGGLLAFLLMDYSTYLWHRLNHAVPFLWRFHRVHHTDLDLDVSTALRFHFGEMLWSVGARAMQVVIIGVGPTVALIWEGAELAATVFHHSNVQLPLALERILSRVIVTPRMHGIHHSIVERETNANWSVLLSAWDRLHRSLRLDVPQAAVVIGLPAHRDPGELGLASLLAMPFRKQGPAWRLPSGAHPDRVFAGDPRRLAA
jgi:sterol desaturase/sphingolipid hydroxylase (fatty acid hydroxylase superfamily)